MSGWRHNDEESRWELGYYDLPMERWVTAGYVTDEFLERVAMPPAKLAVHLRKRFGSVPPLLAGCLPADAPILSEELAAEIRDALARVERGEVWDLGSFARYADDMDAKPGELSPDGRNDKGGDAQ